MITDLRTSICSKARFISQLVELRVDEGAVDHVRMETRQLLLQV